MPFAHSADAIPLGFAEIVPSLQTGRVGENSENPVCRGIAGEAPHLTLTHHLLGVSLILARKSWRDALPAADRQVRNSPSRRRRVPARRCARIAAEFAAAAKLGFERQFLHRSSVTRGGRLPPAWRAP